MYNRTKLAFVFVILFLGQSVAVSFAGGNHNLLNDGFPERQFKNITPLWGGRHCGSGWTQAIIPDSFFYSTGRFSFAKACATHDKCYARGKGKQACDKKFFRNLKNVCFYAVSKKSPSYTQSCLEYAEFYYHTVVKYGSSFYARSLQR